MKETLIILFFWIITIIVGWLLYLEIQQTLKQKELCENYSLTPQEFKEVCKF